MIFPSPKEASFPEHSWQPTGVSRLTSQKKDATDRRRKLLPRTGQSLQFEMGFFFFPPKVITVMWETSQGVNGKLHSGVDSISILMDKVPKHKILKRI